MSFSTSGGVADNVIGNMANAMLVEAGSSGHAEGTMHAAVAIGELSGILALKYYGKDASELSEEQKQTISAIATLASGLAGGLVGDSGAATLTGAQTGKMTVENNSLGSVARAAEKALEGCIKNATCRSVMNQMGISIGLTNAQIEEAMKAGATRDPAVIAKLTPEQIAYQICK